MLTPRGRSVLAMAVVFFLVGRVLALRELHMAAAAMATLLVSAIVTVALRGGTLAVTRHMNRTRTTAGGEVRVELDVRNRGRLGGGPVLFEDVLPERLNVAARLALPALPPGTERKLAYVLRPKVRGRYVVGPLEVALADPFGLVLRRQAVSATSTVIVYPSFDRLETVPRDVRRVGAVRRSPLLGPGDEFFALRPYREGDDLRKVHWPSSFRTGEIVVRQEELLREPGMFVVVDSCASKHRGEGPTASIEAAVSACASVAMLALDRGMPLSILTPDGVLLRTSRPSEEELLEALATLEPSSKTDLQSALGSPWRRGLGGASIVVITPVLSEGELARFRELSAGASGGAAVHVVAPSFDTRAAAELRGQRTEHALATIGLPVLRLHSGDSFYDLWERGVRGVALAR